MTMTETLPQLLLSLGAQIPLLAVWVIGAVLAMAFWKHDPRKALLVLLACLICLCTDVGFSIVYAVLPRYLHEIMTGNPSSIRWIFTGLGVIRSGLVAVAWALVLVAVFRRSPAD